VTSQLNTQILICEKFNYCVSKLQNLFQSLQNEASELIKANRNLSCSINTLLDNIFIYLEAVKKSFTNSVA
jgi:hypothetical protein